MEPTKIAPPLTNVQQELLKLFATNLPDEQLQELREVIAIFLIEKARDQADTIWDEQKYDEKTIEKLLSKGL